MEKNINSNYPIVFLTAWVVLWFPYSSVFLLGNPPIDFFSLYDLVNRCFVIKIAIGVIAILSELALIAAIVTLAVSFFKEKGGNLWVLFLVVMAVAVNFYQLSFMVEIVTR